MKGADMYYTEKLARFIHQILIVLIIVIGIGIAAEALEFLHGPSEFFGKMNSTDSHTSRSGLDLYTDYGTGCQYLRVGSSQLIQRVNHFGSHVCIDSLRNRR